MNTLSLGEAVDLAGVIDTAIHSRKVARSIGNDVVYGIARSVGDERGAFAAPNDDVRDCHLRVTTQSGLEAFWPVRELIGEMSSGLFCQYDW